MSIYLLLYRVLLESIHVLLHCINLVLNILHEAVFVGVVFLFGRPHLLQVESHAIHFLSQPVNVIQFVFDKVHIHHWTPHPSS